MINRGVYVIIIGVILTMKCIEVLWAFYRGFKYACWLPSSLVYWRVAAPVGSPSRRPLRPKGHMCRSPPNSPERKSPNVFGARVLLKQPPCPLSASSVSSNESTAPENVWGFSLEAPRKIEGHFWSFRGASHPFGVKLS